MKSWIDYAMDFFNAFFTIDINATRTTLMRFYTRQLSNRLFCESCVLFFLFYFFATERPYEQREDCGFRSTYNLDGIYYITNLSMRYSLNIVVAQQRFFLQQTLGRASPALGKRDPGNFARYFVFHIGACYFAKNSRRRASQRLEIAKFKSAIALPLISRSTPHRTHTYTYVF